MIDYRSGFFIAHIHWWQIVKIASLGQIFKTGQKMTEPRVTICQFASRVR